MGLLDNKGLKKLVNWVNDKVNNIKVPETGQPVWDFRPDTFYSSLYFNIKSYKDEYIKNLYTDMLIIRFDNDSYTPDPNKEYKHRAAGKVLNKYEWPSLFDMNWPNNEIPVFDEDKQYEIYIAGGRVVSVSDITPLVEEVTYIIQYNDEGYFKLQGGSEFAVSINGGSYENYNGVIELTLPQGTTSITIHDAGENRLSNVSEIYISNYEYLKVDCSKMKSNNFNRVTLGLKIDEIIYPQACFGVIDNPVYAFETDEVNLDFLYKNDLSSPRFSFKANNLFINNSITTHHTTNTNTFYNTKLTNKQINKIIEFSNNRFYRFSSFGTSNDLKSKYMTLGTIENCINIEDIFINLGRTYLFFANVVLEGNTNINKIKEGIIDCRNHYIYFSHGIDAKLYILNCNWEASNFNIIGNLTVYHFDDIPPSVIESSHNVTFIKINNFFEIPFQYAPATWDDVKDYDENGNVID